MLRHVLVWLFMSIDTLVTRPAGDALSEAP